MSSRGWLLVVWVLVAIGGAAAARQPETPASGAVITDGDLRALIDAGRFADAEKHGLARVASLEPSGNESAIADALELVVLARHLGRRLTQPDTVALAERALRIREGAFGPADPRVASSLVLAGLARGVHRRVDEGRDAIARAITIRERAFGLEHLEFVNALNALAALERIAGRNDAARDAASRALAIASRVEQPAGREAAAAHATLAFVLQRDDDLVGALRHAEEVVAIEERLYGPAHPALVSSLLPLAIIAGDLGDLERSRALRERAIRLLENTPGSDYRLAFELMLHSNWMNQIGEYADSLAAAERAATLSERVNGPQSSLYAGALDQLAATHGMLGNHADEALINKKAVTLWLAAQGPLNLHTAKAWQALAISYENAGRIDEAFEAVEQAIKSPALAKEPLALLESLRCKVRLLMVRGRLDEARAILTDARRLADESRGTRYGRTSAGATLLLFGRLERQQGRLTEAIAQYREALVLLEQSLGPANPRNVMRRLELAGVLAETGERDEVRRLLIDNELASLDHLRLISRALPDQGALAYAAERTSGLDLAVSLAAAAAIHPARAASASSAARREGARPTGAGDLDLAFDLLIRGRTVILDEMAARQHAVTQGAADPMLRDRWATLNRARTRLANLIVRGPEQHPIERYQALVDRARTDRDQAERDLAQASASFRQEQQRTRAGREDVLAHLPVGSAMVSYVRYTPQPLAPVGGPSRPGGAANGEHVETPAAYAALVSRPGKAVRMVLLGDAERVEQAIGAWRDRIRDELDAAGLAARRGETRYREAGAALRALVWDPVRTLVGSASTVFVVPDGALHLVDLATLPTGDTGYLVDAPFVLHYLLAERDLLQRPSSAASGSLFALGAPDFDNAARSVPLLLASQPSSTPTPAGRSAGPASTPAPPPSSVLAAIPPAAASDAAPAGVPMRGAATLCRASFGARYEPLPATDDEVRHVADLWRRRRTAPASDIVLLDGPQASESAFKTLARGRRVLHLATHGFFLERSCGGPAEPSPQPANQRVLDEGPLLRSGLVLAGANQRAPGDADADDGILTAEEIAGLDLSDTQWAVLSACDTGRGDWQAGEGVLGLRRAFQVAGARTVILSLWPVIDHVTSEWMTELYRRKWASAATTTAAAVRGANRTLLAARRAKGESTHPLYWSGFIATGDWR